MVLIIIPFVQAYLLSHVFGEITDFKVTLVNDEVIGGLNECYNSSLKTISINNNNNNTCHYNKLSCRFIKHLDTSCIDYNILSNMNEVNIKDTDAVIYFASNFTASYTDLLESNLHTSDGSIVNSRIQVFMGNKHAISNSFLKKALLKTTKSFIDDLLVVCGESLKLNSPSIDFKEPIFGTDEFDIRYQSGLPLEMM